ncbi:acyl-CoA synthetase family protein [Chryseobacterium echinoideorum]|uniref:AMP-binding protein n=1 Tax=Chryseobacterium echinoideorum TaxID=1549648 RepID=UPI0011870F9B|nr:AMP-binding protein [Chryseobacterium echinoideorum]
MKIDFNNLKINQLNPENKFEKKIIFFLEEWLSDSEKVKIQTSGSTGIPKIFEIEKNRMISSAKMTCDFLNLKKENSALLCLPIEYISGKMMIARSFERKLMLTIKEPSLNPLLDINDFIDFCAMTPLQVENSLNRIQWIKNLIIGGASVSESLKKKIFQILLKSNSSNRIFETYGMSETLSHIALKQIYPVQEEFFTILDGVKISTDERKCLTIAAPKLNPEVLQTNDIVELISEKQFIFLGRYDNVINSGGVKIFPEELENLVKKNIDRDLIFIGKPDEKLGEKLVLVIEGNTDNEINHHLSQINYESKFHSPKEILFLEKFPRSENGKVLRREVLKLI